ncbi:MAG: hypothetical protein VX359_04070 [Chloroflexota bacterium]
MKNINENFQTFFRLILFLSLSIIFFACSDEDTPTVIEPTIIAIAPDTIPTDPKANDPNQAVDIVAAPTVDIEKIVEIVISRLPTPEIVTIPPTPEIPDIQATAISVLDSILILTPTVTPLPTSTPTPTPTNTPTPTFTPTPTMVPSLITINTGSTIVSQSGTKISIKDATASSSRANDNLTVDIYWGDGTSTKTLAVKNDGSIAAEHIYTYTGIFPVKFIVTNQDGASSTEEINYIINAY